MTTDIAITLIILLLSVILFITEILRVDLIALLVMGSLALTGVLTPSEALSGFSNPAVITVWAMFIISGALSRTGVATQIGNRVLGMAGNTEIRLVAMIMLTAGVLSAFMNNVGVAALLLPVVMDIARRTKLAPSRLLMPLAFGCLLGGMTTLIGTPPNILASEALSGFGLSGFNFFDFTPVGSVLLVIGIGFVVLIGKYLLPLRNISKEAGDMSVEELEQIYDISEDLYVLSIPEDSLLAGKSLAESRFASVLDINVIGIVRNGKTRLAPGTNEILLPGDRLIVTGGLDKFYELHGRRHLIVEEEPPILEKLISPTITIAELEISSESSLINKTIRQIDFRNRYKLIVLAILREGRPIRTHLDVLPIKADDALLLQGEAEKIQELADSPDFELKKRHKPEAFKLQERLMVVRIPDDSYLVNRPLEESRLSESLGLGVLGIVREGETTLMPTASEKLLAGDILIIRGREENLNLLRDLKELDLDSEAAPEVVDLETEEIGLMECVLSPHTSLPGKTLRQIHFREKYGLNVLAILREGQAYRSNLRDIPLRFGDALLLFGNRQRLTTLSSDPDFLILTEGVQEAPRSARAPFAILIMLGVIVSVIAGLIPISIAGVVGAALMVASGALTMEEAYRDIDWRAVFLIAGMLPLGIAMETSGAAKFITEAVIAQVGAYGIIAVMAGIFLLTNITSQVMPNAVVTVLMIPIAYNTAIDLGVSPYSISMLVAIAASASFMSPVGHPANVLVMGPGGYRFYDFVKVGLPLTLIVLIVTLFVLPIFWPL